MKNANTLNKTEREAAHQRYSAAKRGMKGSFYESGEVIPHTGRYTVHNRLGKLMLHETLWLRKKEQADGAWERFPMFGHQAAWYVPYQKSGKT